jgi:amino acid permease
MPSSTTEVESPPQADANATLSHGLKQRHLSMIALGGVIGAGLFVGSGASGQLLAGVLAMVGQPLPRMGERIRFL